MIKLIDLLEARIKELVDLNTRFNNFDKKGIKYLGFSFRRKLTYWNTGKYIQKVEIPGLKVISRLKGTLKEKIKMALDDNVKVHCTCPDWKFGGFEYIGTQTEYSLHKENRPPDIKNPELSGSICKHLNYLLININNYVDRIEEDYNATRKTRKTIIHNKSFVTKIKQMGLKRGRN